MNKYNKWFKIFSYILIFFFILIIIPLNLFLCLISGFMTYELINFLNKFLEKLIKKKYSKYLSIIILLILFIFIFLIIFLKINIFIKENIINLSIMTKYIDKYFLIINKNIKNKNLNFFFKECNIFLKNEIYFIIKYLFTLTKNILKILIYKFFIILIGIIIGILIFLNNEIYTKKVFLIELKKRIKNLSISFKNFILAQIKISLVNTFFISIIKIFFIYKNINFPLYNFLIIITFLLGLLPVIGNIISNIILLILISSISIRYFIFILLYIILINKLEYIINILIIKNYTKLKIWEILLSMILFYSIFGVEGLIAAPIYYSYIKYELKLNNII